MANKNNKLTDDEARLMLQLPQMFWGGLASAGMGLLAEGVKMAIDAKRHKEQERENSYNMAVQRNAQDFQINDQGLGNWTPPMMSSGGPINIKKKNRGKFTEYCGGKVTNECIQRGKRSKNPTTRKRATFAQNARKWSREDGGDIESRIDFPGVKYANPYLVPEYNQPMDGDTILPDLNRPGLIGTNATEYKTGIGVDGREIQVPRIVGGQLLSPEGAVERYMLTNENFGEMANPSAYSNFYDMASRLGLMKKENGGMFMNSGAENPMINEYDGQTHQGPTGGIPIDGLGRPTVVSGGKPVALTEDGEVSHNGYVFSDTLKSNDNKTFADEAKKILKKYKTRLGDDFSRHDKLAEEAMERELGELKQQNEIERVKKEYTRDDLNKMWPGGPIDGEDIFNPSKRLASVWHKSPDAIGPSIGPFGTPDSVWFPRTNNNLWIPNMAENNSGEYVPGEFSERLAGVWNKPADSISLSRDPWYQTRTNNKVDLNIPNMAEDNSGEFLPDEYSSALANVWHKTPDQLSGKPATPATNLNTPYGTPTSTWMPDGSGYGLLGKQIAEANAAKSAETPAGVETPAKPSNFSATQETPPEQYTFVQPIGSKKTGTGSEIGTGVDYYLSDKNPIKLPGDSIIDEQLKGMVGGEGSKDYDFSNLYELPKTKIKPDLSGVIASGAGAITNIIRGLLDKPKTYNPESYMISSRYSPVYMRDDEAEKAEQNAYANRLRAAQNMSPAQAAKFQAITEAASQDRLAQMRERIFNINAQLKNQADQGNIGIEQQNAATRMRVDQMNEANEAARDNLITTGISQLGQTGQMFARDVNKLKQQKALIDTMQSVQTQKNKEMMDLINTAFKTNAVQSPVIDKTGKTNLGTGTTTPEKETTGTESTINTSKYKPFSKYASGVTTSTKEGMNPWGYGHRDLGDGKYVVDKFNTYDDARKTVEEDLARKISSGKYKTVGDIVSGFAGKIPQDKLANYFKTVSEHSGYTKDTPVNEIDAATLAKAMLFFENPDLVSKVYGKKGGVK
jgi:hypothetical protein